MIRPSELVPAAVLFGALFAGASVYAVPHIHNELTQEAMRRIANAQGDATAARHRSELLPVLSRYGITDLTVSGHHATVRGAARPQAEIDAIKAAATHWGLARVTYEVDAAAAPVPGSSAGATTSITAAAPPSTSAAPTTAAPSTSTPVVTTTAAPATTAPASTTTTVAPATTAPPPTTAPPAAADVASAQREIDTLASAQLNTVFFATGSSELSAEARGVLDRIADVLRRYPGVVVEVGGHTDAQGDPAANQLLSEQRAEAVRAYLLGAGIAPARVSAVGYGQTRPVADNATAEGRAQNRRVQFTVTKGN